MNRKCPNCSEDTIPISELLVSSFDCSSCGKFIGVHWLFRAAFFIVILLITVPTVIAIFVQQGVYAALLWAPFPIGALGYVKARFCPLEEKRRRDNSRRTYNT